jgi:DNA-binding beta-propeller fold protein YncE
VKRRVVLFAVLDATTVASGQWLERTFWLFDSFPDLDQANLVFENPVTHRIYLTGWNCDTLNVYDPGSGTKFGFFDTARYCADYVCCPSQHLIWLCSWSTDNALVAFDDRADTVIRMVEDVVDRPIVLAYVPGLEKLYVASDRDPLVVSCDAATGAVLDSISFPEDADFLVYDSLRNRLYVSGQDWDTCSTQVLDCMTDSVVAGISGATYMTDMVLHPGLDRLYCLCIQDTVERNVVRVVDLDSLAVRDSVLIPLSEDWHDGGRLMPDFDRDLLWAGYINIWGDEVDDPRDTIVAIDVAGDSIVAMVRLLGDFDPSCFAVNRTEGKLYLSSWNCEYLAVVGSDGSVDFVKTAPEASGVGWSPTYNQVYVVGENDTLYSYDGVGDTLVGLIDYFGLRPDWVWWYPAGSRLYVANSDGIGWLNDEDTLGKWTPMDLGSAVPLLGVYEERNRLYLQWESDTGNYIVAYDCSIDSVVAVTRAPGRLGRGLLLPGHGKMFMTWGDSVAVYNLDMDSVVASRYFTERRLMVYNPRADRVYCYRPVTSDIAVVNPEWETVIGNISVFEVDHLVVNERENELWVLTSNDTLFVADCSTNTVVDTVVPPHLGVDPGLFMVEENNKLYCLDDTMIWVVRCPTRTLSTIDLRDFHAKTGQCFLNRRNDKLYVSRDYRSSRIGLRAINCRWDSVVGSVEASVVRWAWDSVGNVMYGFNGKQVSVIKDDPSGIRGRHSRTSLSGRMRSPTLMRRTLALPGKQPATLLDVTGRKVTDLEPGPNNIRQLAPGVYFVSRPETEDGGPGTAVRKVVVQR